MDSADLLRQTMMVSWSDDPGGWTENGGGGEVIYNGGEFIFLQIDRFDGYS